jgi:uncharacterized protein YggE
MRRIPIAAVVLMLLAALLAATPASAAPSPRGLEMAYVTVQGKGQVAELAAMGLRAVRPTAEQPGPQAGRVRLRGL